LSLRDEILFPKKNKKTKIEIAAGENILFLNKIANPIKRPNILSLSSENNIFKSTKNTFNATKRDSFFF
jgi:hypothetical protein